MRHFHCADHRDWTKEVSTAPLSGRSWAFQERLLSRRILHFAGHQLYWECSMLEASEAFPNGLPDGFGEQFKQLLPYSSLPQTQQQGPMSRGVYGIWDQVMKKYASGKLSRRTDRLVALSGIAHKLQRTILTNDIYLEGLWKNDLAFELLWDVQEPQVPTPGDVYIAPTWSWASRSGTVPCEEEVWVSAIPLIDIINARTLTINHDPMGHVHGGSIRLSGFLAHGNVSRVNVTGSPKPHIALKLDEHTAYTAVCQLDEAYTPTVPLPRTIYCLPILRGLRERFPIYKGLLLVPSGWRSEFRR